MSTRHLIFTDGSSNKFWKIELDGESHTVTFGRVGTDGQSKTKDFDDAEAAKKSFDKLIEQKVKKGYLDAGQGSAKTVSKTPAASKGVAASKTMKKQKSEVRSELKQPAVEADRSVTREIDLDPNDWFMASFRNRERLDRGEPPESDLDAAAKKLAGLKATHYGWALPYEKIGFGPIMARDDAHFWLEAMTGNPGRLNDKAAVEKYATEIHKATKGNGTISLAEATKRVFGAARGAGIFDDCLVQPVQRRRMSGDRVNARHRQQKKLCHFGADAVAVREFSQPCTSVFDASRNIGTSEACSQDLRSFGGTG